MEHPGVNFGCYLKPEARLPRAMRRQMFAGLRWSSEASTAARPATCTSSRPTRRHGTASATGSASIMMWVNRSYSTGEVRLTSPDPSSKPDIDFNMCSDWRDMERLVHGRAHDDPTAGASGRAETPSRRFSRSATAIARATYAVYSRCERDADLDRRRG